MIRAYVSGDAQGFVDLEREIYDDLEPRMLEAVDRAASIFRDRVRLLLSRQGEPQPGGPPAERTGELRRSIEATPARATARQVRARVGVVHANRAEQGRIARKAAALEYGGTDRQGRLHPPYPFMRPAAEQVREAVERAMEEV